jgi:hypothetical protein
MGLPRPIRARRFSSLLGVQKVPHLDPDVTFMKITKAIDPKFHIEDEDSVISIVKTSNGEPIPDDEPKMLFRARDRHALETLRYYRAICADDDCTDFQMAGIENRMAAFEQFRREHFERMKQPGITRGL